jgi:hypothetical protein
MKKLTLLLVAVAFLAGGVNAQSCCKKKGEHCSKSSACCKDKKNCKHEGSKESKETKETKSEPAKKTS